jgi:hypothetical protein
MLWAHRALAVSAGDLELANQHEKTVLPRPLVLVGHVAVVALWALDSRLGQAPKDGLQVAKVAVIFWEGNQCCQCCIASVFALFMHSSACSTTWLLLLQQAAATDTN